MIKVIASDRVMLRCIWGLLLPSLVCFIRNVVADEAFTLLGTGGTMSAPLFPRLDRIYNTAADARGLPRIILQHHSKTSMKARNELLDLATTHYGALDVMLPPSDFKAYRDLLMVPFVVTAVVPVVNIAELVEGDNLVLSRDAIADIFMGRITRWDHPNITALNPSISLPPEPINIIVPSVSLAVSSIFTTALSSFSADFASTIGISSFPRWCQGTTNVTSDPTLPYQKVSCAEGNVTRTYFTAKEIPGVTAAFNLIPYSLTYMFYSEAVQRDFLPVQLFNRANALVTASVDSVTAALMVAEGTFDSRFNASVIDTHSPLGWPINAMTYILLRTKTHINSCQHRSAVVEFFRSTFTDPQFADVARSAGYAVLSDFSRRAVVQLMLERMSCVPNCIGVDKAVCTCLGSGRRCVQVSTVADMGSKLYLGYSPYIQSSVEMMADNFRANSSHVVHAFPSWMEDVTMISSVGSDLDSELSVGLMPSAVFLSMDNASQTLVAEGKVAIIPFFVGTVSMIMNLGSTIRNVTVTPNLLAEICLGNVSTWNDPKIQELNPDKTLPSAPIIIAIDVGATEISYLVSGYLSNVSADFSKVFGPSNLNILRTFRSNVLELTSEFGVRGTVATVQGAMGFVWTRESEQLDTSLVLMAIEEGERGATGKKVINPDLTTMRNCIASLEMEAVQKISKYGSAFRHVTQMGCWPLSIEYNVMAKRVWTADASVIAKKVARFMDWIYTSEMYKHLAMLTPELGVALSQPIVNSVSLGKTSILSPQPPCTREDMVFSLSTCRRQVVTASFRWKNGEEEDRACLGGLSLQDDIEFGCEHVPVDSSMGIGIVALVILSCLLLLPFMVFTYYYRFSKALVASQINFTLLFIVGAILLAVSSLSLLGENNDQNCVLRPWALSLSFSVLFAPLLMKLKRVYMLFGQKTIRRMVVSNLRVAGETLVFLLVDLIILLSWQFASKMSSTTTLESIDIVGDVPREVCDYGNNNGLYVMLAYKGVILGVGVYLAVKSWHIVEDYSEAKQLAIGLYNATLMGGLTLLLTLGIDTAADIKVVLLSVSCCLVSVICVVLVMTPKLFYLYKNPGSRTSTKKASALEPSSALPTAAMNGPRASIDMTGRNHPSIAATGRLSSVSPTLGSTRTRVAAEKPESTSSSLKAESGNGGAPSASVKQQQEAASSAVASPAMNHHQPSSSKND